MTFSYLVIVFLWKLSSILVFKAVAIVVPMIMYNLFCEFFNNSKEKKNPVPRSEDKAQLPKATFSEIDVARKEIRCNCMVLATDTTTNGYRYRYDRGRQEVDQGRHEADRGLHEAELWNEDIRYMWFPKGPNSVSLG
ncbi:hypothetical protein T4D_5794 [Trichinella pseudospiralis]|uniref:Uncharacterized protein n=1 Tax=Trichinella pseudospiralis TaxID=6337 RepID=A0A0V1FUL8_TRIPS|nr:hypothetical protein T4D_5794 [Trichinella pseudospiralis]